MGNVLSAPEITASVSLSYHQHRDKQNFWKQQRTEHKSLSISSLLPPTKIILKNHCLTGFSQRRRAEWKKGVSTLLIPASQTSFQRMVVLYMTSFIPSSSSCLHSQHSYLCCLKIPLREGTSYPVLRFLCWPPQYSPLLSRLLPHEKNLWLHSFSLHHSLPHWKQLQKVWIATGAAFSEILLIFTTSFSQREIPWTFCYVHNWGLCQHCRGK